MPVYSDLNTYSPTQKPLLTDIQDIYQAIDNLVRTQKGERMFRPTYGGGTENFLFELMDFDMSLTVLKEIADNLAVNEPRVQVSPGDSLILMDPDKNTATLNIAFKVPTLGEQNFIFEGTI